MWAEYVVLGLGVYFGVGVLFALLFLTVLIGRMDPAAKGTSPWFRLIISPGVVGLWPLMLVKVLSRGKPA